MNKGLVSVIVPTLNAKSHLKVLLPSLEKQTYKNFEVIINDDKRTSDDTNKFISQFKKKFKLMYIQKNTSMAQGRKSGSQFANSEYLLHLDADMKLSKKVLEECVKESSKGYDALVIPEISYGKGFWAKVKAFERSMYIGDDTMSSARFIKSEVYRKIGGHNEKMVLSEDKDLHLRLKKAGYNIGTINEPIYHNEGNLSLKKDLQKKYFYGTTAHLFIVKNPKHAFLQANLIFRPAYFRNWKKIISNPRLSTGMFYMKTLETFMALLGLITAGQIIFTEKTLADLKNYKPMKSAKVTKNLISIIIPTLNAAYHLKTLLPSLERQTYKNFEVIINDDKKTIDNTKDVVKKYYKDIKIRYLQINYSMAQGRKSAAEFAKGEYILHLDADMKLSKTVLESAIEKFHSGCDALVIPEISYGKGFWAKVRIFERSMYIGDETIESARFFKTSVYKKVGGHNERMVLSEDKDLDLRVRRLGFKVCRILEPVYHNEGGFNLIKGLRKKFFYGRSANILILANPGYSLKYGNIVFRPAFFRNWRELFKHPLLTISVFFLKFLETIAGIFGMISTRLPFLKEDMKVEIWK